MRTTILLSLPLGLTLSCLGCAPMEEPPSSEPTLPPPVKVDPVIRDTAAPTSGLQARVEMALRNIHQRDLLTTHSFWTVFHGILGTGLDATLLDPMTNKRVRAIDYICKGGEIRGLQFIATADGLDVRTGPQFVGQGHQDQFIAEMAQWGLKADTKFLVNGKDYTLMDFIRHTQARARVTANQELSWAVVVIAQYLGTDARWTNRFGEKLCLEDVVRYELNQSVEQAACGGTHRLFGLTWAYYLHLRKGGSATGVWKEVADKIADYQKRARKYQNADGSFSTKYLAGPGNSRDAGAKIGSTGHVFEWLALSLPDTELRAPWMQDAANALALMVLDSQGSPVEGGALYHACHGLHIYHDRVFGPNARVGHGPMIPLPPEVLAKPH
jgi:hypothetical protein